MADKEFPEIIRLNVGGYHFTTLLSTLKKDKDSNLAAMFSGLLPVYKDKDDKYFLDGDGKIFHHILDYLRTDSLPEGINSYTLFGANNDKMVTALHKEATLFGLKELAHHLEKYKGPFVDKQLENFRNSMDGYQDCMDQILKAVPVNSLLGSTKTVVVLVTERSGQQVKCCDHTCNFNNPTFAYLRQEDIVSIQVPFPVDHTILNCLYLDFTNQGYSINSGISECNFYCEKGPVNLFGATAFGKKTQRQCCREPIYYIQFNWLLAPTNKGFSFGEGTTFGSGFGSKSQSSSFGFQSSKLGATLFGSQPSQGGLFGSNNNKSGSLFGGDQQGGSQGSGVLFGSSQQQNTAKSAGLFGSPQAKVSGFGFGSSSNLTKANQKTPFGKPASQSQSESSFTFGSPSPFGLAPSKLDSFGQSQTAPTFGQTPSGTAFGQTPAPAFGQAPAAPAFGQAPEAAAFGHAPDAPAFGQAPAAQGFGQTPAFGQAQASPAVVAPAFGKAVAPGAPVFANTPAAFGQVQAAPVFDNTNTVPAFGALYGEVDDPKNITFAVPKAENIGGRK